MILESDIKNLSLQALYDLMTFKIEELQTIRKTYSDHDDLKKEIQVIQKVIDCKKVIPLKL